MADGEPGTDGIGRIDWERTALFLDLDGTLAPIVARPEAARVSAVTLATVARLAERTGGAVAVISGRDLGQIDAMMAPLVLPAAGSHGAVRRDAAGRLHRAEGMGAALATARAAIAGFAAPHGLLVEAKAGAVCLHYRARPDLGPEVQALVDRLAAEIPGLKPMHGHMVAELVASGIDKGRALSAFMAEPPFAGRMALAVGDDTTDEDAFAAAQGAGGTAIRIGPGATRAHHRLPEIGAFLDWLDRQAGT